MTSPGDDHGVELGPSPAQLIQTADRANDVVASVYGKGRDSPDAVHAAKQCTVGLDTGPKKMGLQARKIPSLLILGKGRSKLGVR